MPASGGVGRGGIRTGDRRSLLGRFPDLPATVISERVGWGGAPSVRRARVALIRPSFRGADPADRTTYAAGARARARAREIVQCDLWFPLKVVPDGAGAMVAPPVLTMVAAYSWFVMALMLPARVSWDLLAGTWQLLSGIGAVPKMLVWDNEARIGQHHRLTVPARGFAGTLGTRIYQTAARDPEAKGMVERANGFLQTSFMPGGSSPAGPTSTPSSPAGCRGRTPAWSGRPVDMLDADVAAMGALPRVVPATALPLRGATGPGLLRACRGKRLLRRPRRHRALRRHRRRPGAGSCHLRRCGRGRSPPAAGRRGRSSPTRLTSRPRNGCGPRSPQAPSRPADPPRGTSVKMRALSDYDALFALNTTDTPAARPDLQVVR